MVFIVIQGYILNPGTSRMLLPVSLFFVAVMFSRPDIDLIFCDSRCSSPKNEWCKT